MAKVQQDRNSLANSARQLQQMAGGYKDMYMSVKEEYETSQQRYEQVNALSININCFWSLLIYLARR